MVQISHNARCIAVPANNRGSTPGPKSLSIGCRDRGLKDAAETTGAGAWDGLDRISRGVRAGGGAIILQTCDDYGPGYYYIPGTLTCVHAATGRIERTGPFSAPVLRLIDQTEEANRAIEAATVTLAIPMPIILSGHRFALAGNWSYLSAGYHAFGLAAAVSIGNGLSINAGVGVGVETLVIGTRFGLNFNW